MENQSKKLYRSQTDKIIAGVCGGLARYFDIDPVLMRAAFILLALINGAGIILYIILIFIVPKEPGGQEASINREEKIKEFAQDLKDRAQEFAGEISENKPWLKEKRNIIGLIVVFIGIIALLNQLFPVHWFSWSIFWPLALVFIGFYIIFNKKSN
ncbi:MAG: PspC domain-containing protein [Candidatus Portnoybacteria bacterium]|nr:PspC domain-containing protein [Candidatus Portnoybacteria bacterium]